LSQGRREEMYTARPSAIGYNQLGSEASYPGCSAARGAFRCLDNQKILLVRKVRGLSSRGQNIDRYFGWNAGRLTQN